MQSIIDKFSSNRKQGKADSAILIGDQSKKSLTKI